MPSRFTLKLPPRFDLTRAVCSYGYFILAPNRWDPTTHRLHRPLRGVDDRLVGVTIAQRPGSDRLTVTCDTAVTLGDRNHLAAQVARMLRLDEPAERFEQFWALHPEARRAGFARLFRSPTLFEDIVKTITGCNVTWPNTMRMNELLCARCGDGGFPTPGRIAALSPATLKRTCKVGYRAGRIVRLGRRVARGQLDLAALEDSAMPTDALYDALLEIEGIGPYAAANLCMLLGRYDRLAIDSETYRHFRQVHRVKTPKNPAKLHRRIERFYARYKPFQFLAYWFELWCHYERVAGDARTWEAHVQGRTFTASKLKSVVPG